MDIDRLEWTDTQHGLHAVEFALGWLIERYGWQDVEQTTRPTRSPHPEAPRG